MEGEGEWLPWPQCKTVNSCPNFKRHCYANYLPQEDGVYHPDPRYALKIS